MKITIKKGDASQLAPHFKASEFFSLQPGKHAITEHDFYTELVEAVEYLRTHYNVPWRVTSTYRPDSPGSQHRECRAVDSQDTGSYKGHTSATMVDLVGQLLDPKSEVFVNLRRIGITGIGVYDTFVHLDCRDTTKFPAAHRDKFGRYAAWDDRTEAGKALQPDAAKKKASGKILPSKSQTPNPRRIVDSPLSSSV